MLLKAFNLEKHTEKVFVDTVNHWSREIIATAYEHGIIQGYNDSAFGPDDPITREQMAVMIVNAAGVSNDTGNTLFADHDEISSWAINQVLSAAQNHLINGYPDLTFRAKNLATRAEAATIILRAMEKEDL